MLLTLWPPRLLLCMALATATAAAELPGNAAAAQNARALEQKGDLTGAAAIWRRMIDADAGNIEALVNLGILDSRLGQYTEAQELYKKALRREPRNADILLNLALAYFKNNDLKSAIPALQKVTVLRPKDERARTLLGISYYGTGDFGRAWPTLEAVPAVRSNIGLRQMLAHAYIWSGQIEKGSAEVEAILRDSPDSAVAHVLLGEALDGGGKPADALKEFQAAAKINDTEPNVHFAMGFICWREKRFEEAESEFRRELALDPAHSQAMAYLGDIELQRNNSDAARLLLEHATRLRSDIRVAEYDLGVLLQKDGDHAGAIAHFERAVALARDRADAHYRLAISYRALGREQDAAAQLALVKTLHDRKLDETIYKVAPAPRTDMKP